MTGSNALPEAYRLSDVASRSEVAADLPRCVFIEVTNLCNLICTTCPRTFVTYEPPHDLSLDEFTAIVAQFPQMQRAVLHGIGEPLLNAHLPQMVRYLKDRGVYVLFNSNGTLLTPQVQDALIASGLDELRVSLDSADPKTYAQVRGRPLLGRVVQNLRQFTALQRRMGAVTPRVSLWSMGMQENIAQLPALVRLAAEMGIAEVYLQRLTYFVGIQDRQGLAQDEQALFGHTDEAIDAVLAECSRLSEQLGIAFQASGATRPDESLRAAHGAECSPWRACLRPWTTAYVTANGNLLPCCIAPFATTDYAGLVLGNLWETDMGAIWNAARYRAWRSAVLNATPHEACSGCGVHWSL